jgi:hypothetical protein
MVCLETIAGRSALPACGHQFHDECWRGHFEAKVSKAPHWASSWASGGN